jgi:hypothetical protein
MRIKGMVAFLLKAGGLSAVILAGLWLASRRQAQPDGGFSADVNALQGAVDYVLSEKADELRDADIAQEAAIAQDDLTAAAAAIQSTLTEWEALHDEQDCLRAQALMKKYIEWSEESGKSLDRVLKDAVQSHEMEIAKLRDKLGGGLAGRTEQADLSRALVNDTVALLKILEIHQQAQAQGNEPTLPVCNSSVDSEIFAFGDAVNAVLAEMDSRNERFNQYEAERLAKANAHWWKQTGKEEFLNDAKTLAEKYNLDLAELGIEVETEDQKDGR